MPELEALLAGMFRSYGYRVHPKGSADGPAGGQQTVPLVVEKDIRATAILFEEPSSEDELQEILRTNGCDHAVVVTEQGTSNGENAPGLRRWGPDALAIRLGRAALRQVGRGGTPDPLEQEPRSDAEPRAATKPKAVLRPITHEVTLQEAAPSPAEPTVEEVQPSADDGPQAAPEAPAPAPRPDEGDFEELPGRADRRVASAPPETTPDGGEATGFEELPGRADGAPTPKPKPPAAESSDFEELPGRADQPAQAEPAEPEATDYELLPGRAEAAHESVAPADPGAELLENPDSAPPADTNPDDDWQLLGRANQADAIEPVDAESLEPTQGAPEEVEVPMAFRQEPQAQEAPDEGNVVAVQVTGAVARNMAKRQLGTITDIHLRLVPHHIFSYQARTLVKGRLDERELKGHVAVDAWRGRVVPWNTPLEAGHVPSGDESVVQRTVRMDERSASSLARNELQDIIGRDVTQEEQSDEWEVTVRKHVDLDPQHVQLTSKGLWWHAVWRAGGPDGAVEIDAATGDIIDLEQRQAPTDAQLL